MIFFLVRRLLQAVAVMFVISVIGFAVQGGLGDPVPQMLGPTATDAESAALRHSLGLDRPLWMQYLHFAGNAVKLNFGDSYFFHEPALDVIARYLPATLELVAASAVITLLLSVPMGIFCAIRPRSWLSRGLMGLSLIGISVPIFLTAMVLIQLFSIGIQVTLFPMDTGWGQWLNQLLSIDGGMPAYGRGNPVHVWGVWYTNFASWQGLLYLLLPALSLAFVMLPLFVRLIHAEMLEVLESDYVKYARARGLRPSRIYFLHALKNTLLPVVTLGGVQIGTLVAYTLLTETVFQWPGAGLMFLDAIERADMPLVVAYLMVVGLMFVVTNTLVDLLYRVLNPRVTLSGRSA
ncbi:MAG: ABC transporter permease [Salinicola sp.]|uniref:ABC transporter permease n=1 Tax=Salinicola sp. TaxID=1978524 RepID=UPI001D450705|nr:ABC transporter permease [Salinicola sp.]NRB55266.1 ABC transporter permease [Salinicola sp.]